MELTNFANATRVKLKNRRVMVVSLPKTDDIQIEFKTIVKKEDANTPHAVHRNFKDKIVLTGVRISLEAAVSLYYCLQNEFAKKEIEVTETKGFTYNQ